MTNYWKTSDIKISTDSVGYMTAEHRWQGILIESSAYWPENSNPRTQCRRDAVKVLKEMHSQEAS